jgi:hypothetical protein
MSVEAQIYAALQGLVAGRVFPEVAPELTPRPYITYAQVGGQAVNFIDPTVPSKKHGRFQINVWADTRLAAATLARQVEDTLRVVPALQTTVLGAPVAIYEEDTKLRGTMQDFSVWFDT